MIDIFKNLFIATLLAVAFMGFCSEKVAASEGIFITDEGDSSIVYYYVNDELQTGWQKIDGKWYFFNRDTGVMLRNTEYFLCDEEYKGYSFDENGVMRSNCWVEHISDRGYVTKYYAGNNGRFISGWFQEDGFWYYFHKNTFAMLSDMNFEINGNMYFFDTDGHMVNEGWIFYHSYYDFWLYADGTGKLYTEKWLTYNGNKYYFDKYGYMYQETDVEIDGTYYYFGKNGEMRTGWHQTRNGFWRYYEEDGAVNGWKNINGKWYYFGTIKRNEYNHTEIYKATYKQVMFTGWLNLSGKWYYLSTSGDMVTGWKYINGNWYFFKDDGAMVTGWKRIDSKWYYFTNSGNMLSNTIVDGFVLDKSGAWIE